MRYGLLAGAMFAALLAPQQASATSAVYDFTYDGSSSGLGTGPFGSVTVTENIVAGFGVLDFSVSPASGFRIHETTNSNHNAFAFSLVGDPNVSITNLAAGFAGVATTSGTNVSAPGPGGNDFYTAIACNAACGSGYAGGYVGPLTFTVGVTATSLSLASLASHLIGSNNVYFAADLVSSASGNPTGNVDATLRSGGGGSTVPGVPEPATWAMMLAGFGFVGAAMRRRQRQAVQYSFA